MQSCVWYVPRDVGLHRDSRISPEIGVRWIDVRQAGSIYECETDGRKSPRQTQDGCGTCLPLCCGCFSGCGVAAESVTFIGAKFERTVSYIVPATGDICARRCSAAHDAAWDCTGLLHRSLTRKDRHRSRIRDSDIHVIHCV